MKILIVIDMQNDFVTGTLKNEEAIKIIPKVVEKVNNFDGNIIFTKDTHDENYLNTQEGKNLPILHCIKDSKGWNLIPQLDESMADIIYHKPTFGSIELVRDLVEINTVEKIEGIELIGVCTDICVISNALLIKSFLPEIKLTVVSGCCAGVTKEKHEAALETMRSCHINVI